MQEQSFATDVYEIKCLKSSTNSFPSESEIVTKTKKRLIWLSLALFVVSLVVLVAILLTGLSRAPSVTATERDGYMEIIAAGKLVKGKAPDFENASEAEVREFVEANQETLGQIRLALKHESRVPVEYSLKYTETQEERWGSIRQMARVLMAEGRLAETEQRYSDACRSYLDCIQLGQKIGQGGLFLDFLVEIALEQSAVNRLSGLQEHIDAETTESVLGILKSVRENQEPFEEFIKREEHYAQKIHGVWAHFKLSSELEKSFNRTRGVYDEAVAEMDELIEKLSRAKSQPR